jgi:hypothetical protein
MEASSVAERAEAGAEMAQVYETQTQQHEEEIRLYIAAQHDRD